MRALSITAIEQYRKIYQEDIDLDILKIKIYCLTCSCNKIYATIGGTIYQFGRLKIKVNEEDIVTSIKLDKDEDLVPTAQELKRLEEYYLRNGLDKEGTRYTTEEEQKQYYSSKGW